jgi:hypothetical protein
MLCDAATTNVAITTPMKFLIVIIIFGELAINEWPDIV